MHVLVKDNLIETVFRIDPLAVIQTNNVTMMIAVDRTLMPRPDTRNAHWRSLFSSMPLQMLLLTQYFLYEFPWVPKPMRTP